MANYPKGHSDFSTGANEEGAKFLDYLKNAREKFLSHAEKMNPSLCTRDRVEIEDFVLAYDQATERVKGLIGQQHARQGGQSENFFCWDELALGKCARCKAECEVCKLGRGRDRLNQF